jgi:two-component system, chemotaxis family, protein-glutamate methylesterase/glutaminase
MKSDFKKKRVLIVDDSQLITKVITVMLSSEPDIEVVGTAVDGEDAIVQNKRLKPDVITMDLQMPKMGGLEAISLIMAASPKPIIVLSSYVNDVEAQTAFKAMEAGALALIEKPKGIGTEHFSRIREELVGAIRTLVKTSQFDQVDPGPEKLSMPSAPAESRGCELVAIGCSTGGPAVLQKITQALPENFPAPIIIVQHIVDGFVTGLIGWLSRTSSLKIKLAEHGERLLPGIVYFAPDDCHLTLLRDAQKRLCAKLIDTPRRNGFKPSVSEMLDSVAEISGESSIAGLLTGMGNDGADALKAVHAAGGATFVQDEATSVVYGMARCAVNMGGVDKALADTDIADFIVKESIKKGEI